MKPDATQRGPRRLAGLAACLLCLAAVSGCVPLSVPIIASESYTVDPVFVLPPGPAVILVDTPRGMEHGDLFARQVKARATRQLQDNLGVESPTTLIPPAAVESLRSELGKDFATLAIDDLGRRVGAETVIYAKVERVAMNAQGTLYKPEAQLQVKVIDALTGERLFPAPGEGPGLGGRTPSHPLSVEKFYEDFDARGDQRGTAAHVARTLGDQAGLSLARMFYAWEMPRKGDRAFEEREKFRNR